MARVLVFQHGEGITPGYLGDALAAAGHEVEVRLLHAGDPVPELGSWDGVVSLGGVMGAYQDGDHDWMPAEKRFLARAVESGVPVLGICLGCQLLADTLGGRAYKAPGGAEIAIRPVDLTDAGRADPVVRQLTGPIPLWHGDTWDLPAGGELLAKTELYPQAFRFGSAVGIQPHPEASPEMLRGWMTFPEAARQLADYGIEPAEFAAAIEGVRRSQQDTARRFFGAWAAEIPER